MKALTLTQPWCGLVASGIKLVENRRRSMGAQRMIGERIALHASREVDRDVWRRIIEVEPRLALDHSGPMAERARVHRLAEITSAVIGVATIDKALATWRDAEIEQYRAELSFSDGTTLAERNQARWFFGPVGILLRDVRALERPVPCKGALGFWRLPEDVKVAVEAQL